jgi:cytochrome b561
MSSSNAKRPPLRFSAGMISIHWATAILILAALVLAWTWPSGPARASGIMLPMHEAAGLTILALTALRLILRAAQSVPPESSALTRFEAAASRLTHLLLYAILVAMPVSGFLWATSGGKPVDLLGLLAIPPLLPASVELHDVARLIHSVGQYAVYAVAGLHIAGALFHLAVRRDDVMPRMLPWAERFTRPLPPTAVRPAVR